VSRTAPCRGELHPHRIYFNLCTRTSRLCYDSTGDRRKPLSLVTTWEKRNVSIDFVGAAAIGRARKGGVRLGPFWGVQRSPLGPAYQGMPFKYPAHMPKPHKSNGARGTQSKKACRKRPKYSTTPQPLQDASAFTVYSGLWFRRLWPGDGPFLEGCHAPSRSLSYHLSEWW